MEETVKGSYQSHVVLLKLLTGCEENDNIKRMHESRRRTAANQW